MEESGIFLALLATSYNRFISPSRSLFALCLKPAAGKQNIPNMGLAGTVTTEPGGWLLVKQSSWQGVDIWEWWGLWFVARTLCS